MLDVDCRYYVDTFIKQQANVLPALAMPRARDVRVGQLVDDRHLGPARDHGVDVHLLEGHAAISDLRAGNDLEISDLRHRVRSFVRLDEPDDDIDPTPPQVVPFVQHATGLARPGGGPDIDLQLAALALPN